MTFGFRARRSPEAGATRCERHAGLGSSPVPGFGPAEPFDDRGEPLLPYDEVRDAPPGTAVLQVSGYLVVGTDRQERSDQRVCRVETGTRPDRSSAAALRSSVTTIAWTRALSSRWSDRPAACSRMQATVASTREGSQF